MMEDDATFGRSLEKIRGLRPAVVHFCHDNRTWVAGSKPPPRPSP